MMCGVEVVAAGAALTGRLMPRPRWDLSTELMSLTATLPIFIRPSLLVLRLMTYVCVIDSQRC